LTWTGDTAPELAVQSELVPLLPFKSVSMLQADISSDTAAALFRLGQYLTVMKVDQLRRALAGIRSIDSLEENGVSCAIATSTLNTSTAAFDASQTNVASRDVRQEGGRVFSASRVSSLANSSSAARWCYPA
jgi:hypothetical protein